MKAIERTPQQLLHGGEQYLIPVFQRYYTWKKKDWEQLWDDISLLLEEDGRDRRHFLGSIVCVPVGPQPGNVVAYQVIDGQQRLTTLSVLLCALRDAGRSLGSEAGDVLGAEIEETLLIHRFRKGRERYKVYPRQRDRGAYLSLVETGIASADGAITDAYSYFRARLTADQHDTEATRLRTLFETVAGRIDLVAITLDRENPYRIFKSLNSTGVDLEQSDLVRNHVFMALAPDEQDAFDDARWQPLEAHFKSGEELDGAAFTAFIRDVLLRQGKYIAQSAAFEAFENTYPLPSLQPDAVATELTHLAGLYEIATGRRAHPDPAVEASLAALRPLRISTSYPLVLRLMVQHEQRILDTAALRRCLDSIAGFVLRRYVCGDSSQPYGRWFCSVCRDLGATPEASLHAFLTSKGWPSDERFAAAFGTTNLFGSDYTRVVLIRLEQSMQHASEPVGLDQCSIEHVMPQTIKDDANGRAWQAMLGPDWRKDHERWLHTAGNLTLVGQDYNSAMRNQPFNAKKQTLAASKVYLNRYFDDPELTEWNAAAIELRGRSLAERATKLWRGPDAK